MAAAETGCRCGWGAAATCGRAGFPNCEYAAKTLKISLQNKAALAVCALAGAAVVAHLLPL